MPHAAAALTSYGVGLGMVNAAPLAVRGCTAAGWQRREISGPISSLNVFSGALAACVGYALSGPLVGAMGVGGAATAVAIVLEGGGLALALWLYREHLPCRAEKEDTHAAAESAAAVGEEVESEDGVIHDGGTHVRL